MDGLKERLRQFIRQLKCNHSHTFSFFPNVEKTWWNYKGVTRDKINSITIEGCYKCGKMWCRNYAS